MTPLKSLNDLQRKNIFLTIGNFDGVHLGHKSIIQRMKKESLEHKILIITFNPHPLQVIKKQDNFLITTYQEKMLLLKEEGIDFFFGINFNKNFSRLSPLEFADKFIYPIPGLKKIFVGYDFTFGINKKGNFLFLQSAFKNSPISVERLSEFKYDGVNVSSTQIRSYLSKGEIEKANLFLGRKYFLTGTVVKNLGRGKRIGFPTLNLKHDDGLLIPQKGVYATQIQIGQDHFDSVTNIGFRPTFNDNRGLSIETHAINFDCTIYEEKLKIFFLSRLREEKKFHSSHQLTDQIKKDIEKRKSL